MVYPTTNSNAVAVQIFEKDFTPYSDIVWSFDYYVSNILSDTQLGFCIFLQDAYNLPLSSYAGGNAGIDLGYSGLSAKNIGTYSSFLSAGLSGALIGVGFDSTGCYAVSASDSSKVVRDGVNDTNRILNSVSIRGKWPNYSYNEYNINKPLSTVNFNVLDTNKKTIRARLGNVGQTLYIDYRYSANEEFVNIITQNVTFTITPSSRFRPGITFAKPVSGNSTVPTVFFSNLTVEGESESPTIQSSNTFYPLTTFTLNTTAYAITGNPYVEPRLLYPAAIPKLLPAVPSALITNIDQTVGYINTIDIANIQVDINYAFDSGYVLDANGNIITPMIPDYFNFGYKLNIVGPCTDTALYRTDYFNYASTDNSLLLSLSGFNSTWQLLDNNVKYSNNTYIRPVGVYSSSTNSKTYTITYANE